MAQVIGTVAKLVGVAYARASDGSLREMRLGDDVFDGEVLPWKQQRLAGPQVMRVTVSFASVELVLMWKRLSLVIVLP